jgi:hypothetical protein
MDSWRGSVPEAVQDHVDGMYSYALEAATAFLTKRGEFFPFSYWLFDDDDVAPVHADPGLGERPASVEVLKTLTEAARTERARLQTVATAADVTLLDGSDAVRIQIEHQDGVALQIVVPYRRRRSTGKVTLGETSVSDADALIWAG